MRKVTFDSSFGKKRWVSFDVGVQVIMNVAQKLLSFPSNSGGFPEMFAIMSITDWRLRNIDDLRWWRMSKLRLQIVDHGLLLNNLLPGGSGIEP